MLKYTFNAPPAGAGDVVSREVRTLVNGVESLETIPASQGAFVRTFADGDEVSIFFVDIDDAGNRSPAGLPLAFTAIDTVPPPAPAAPTIAEVTEE